MESLRKTFLSRIENENFHSFDSSEVYADGTFNADAAQASTQPSQAFIVTLTNGFSSIVSSVVFLNAFLSVGAANNGVTTGITPTYGYPNQTYAQFLKYLQSISSRIGLVRTISDTASNLRQTYEIESYNMQGDKFSKTVVPSKNTFQQQSDTIDTPVDFYLTGGTKITLAAMAASSAITFEFYPSKVASSISTIEAGRAYTNPNLSGMVNITNKVPQKMI